jgi:hypothetical protein
MATPMPSFHLAMKLTRALFPHEPLRAMLEARDMERGWQA